LTTWLLVGCPGVLRGLLHSIESLCIFAAEAALRALSAISANQKEIQSHCLIPY
jgi:hypothetical protein